MIESVMFAILTLMVWSGLYRMTWIFTLAEHLIIGLYLGFTVTRVIDVLIRYWWNPVIVGGDWFNPIWFGVFLGVIALTRYHRPTAFMNRWTLAFMAAIGSGLAGFGALRSQIVGQLMIKPWDVTNLFETLNQVIQVVITILVLFYWTFTFRHTGAKSGIARAGRLLFMVMLGTIFGQGWMSNFQIPIGIIGEMAKPPALYVMIVAGIVLLIDVLRRRDMIRI